MANEDTPRVPVQTYLIIYIFIVPPLGAFKSQLGGTYTLSLLFYIVNVSCDFKYINISIFIFHVNNDVLHVGCFFTTQFAMTFPSKCVTRVGIRHGGMSPTWEYLSR